MKVLIIDHPILDKISTPDETLIFASMLLDEFSIFPHDKKVEFLQQLEQTLNTNISSTDQAFLLQLLNILINTKQFNTLFKLSMLIIDREFNNKLPKNYTCVSQQAKTLIDRVASYISPELLQKLTIFANNLFDEKPLNKLSTILNSNLSSIIALCKIDTLLPNRLNNTDEYTQLITKVCLHISRELESKPLECFSSLLNILTDQEIEHAFEILEYCFNINSENKTEAKLLEKLNLSSSEITLKNIISSTINMKDSENVIPPVVLKILKHLIRTLPNKEGFNILPHNNDTNTQTYDQLVEGAKRTNYTITESLQKNPQHETISQMIRCKIFERPQSMRDLAFNEAEALKALHIKGISKDSISNSRDILNQYKSQYPNIKSKELFEKFKQANSKQSCDITKYLINTEKKILAHKSLSNFINFLLLTKPKLDELLDAHNITPEIKKQIFEFHRLLSTIIAHNITNIIDAITNEDHKEIATNLNHLINSIFTINNSKNTGFILTNISTGNIGGNIGYILSKFTRTDATTTKNLTTKHQGGTRTIKLSELYTLLVDLIPKMKNNQTTSTADQTAANTNSEQTSVTELNTTLTNVNGNTEVQHNTTEQETILINSPQQTTTIEDPSHLNRNRKPDTSITMVNKPRNKKRLISLSSLCLVSLSMIGIAASIKNIALLYSSIALCALSSIVILGTVIQHSITPFSLVPLNPEKQELTNVL